MMLSDLLYDTLHKGEMDTAIPGKYRSKIYIVTVKEVKVSENVPLRDSIDPVTQICNQRYRK